SDLDILVICEDLPRSRLSRTELFLKSEKELDPLLEKFYEQGYGLTISPVILTPEEARQIPALFLDMTEDAVILFDRENFLSEFWRNSGPGFGTVELRGCGWAVDGTGVSGKMAE
ncbi:MAG: nucleotidyltransferase domain-containing protein, partial [Candidatus Caldarchaeum sp.]|nr:nucleotidyltransferase domain-containing protein [Candidatus Caldarchaeum sp.]MDW8435939.1 hypothetical protein [Candidatus Caldarchaeum sp.]